MRISLEGKVALVTGGSRGIGAATVRLLRECGARVAFSYKTAGDRAEALAAECGGGELCRAFPQELSTAAEGESLVAAATEAFGRLDILVVNHGVWPPHDQPITTMTDAQWRGTLGINLDSVFGLVRAGAREMLGAPIGSGWAAEPNVERSAERSLERNAERSAGPVAGSIPALGGGGPPVIEPAAYAGERRFGTGEADAQTRNEAGADARELLEEAVYSDRLEGPAPFPSEGEKSAIERFAPMSQRNGNVRGHIVLVASTAAQRGEAFHVDYAASKGALLSLTKSLSSELGPQGILCNCVAPGWVVTEMSAGTLRDPIASRKALAAIPLGRAAEPEEIAGPIAFLCSPWAGFISGEIWNVNGGAVLVG